MKRPLALLCSATLILPAFAPFAQAQSGSGAAAICVRRHARGADNAAEISPLETQVLGQRTWLSGGRAALRVIVTDHRNGKPLRADVALALTPLANGKPDGAARKLFAGQTDALGTLDAGFAAPAAQPGDYRLTVDVNSPLGTDTVTQPIQLQNSSLLLLTSDKPLYQPGQTMHLRALAMNVATRHALGQTPITFEIEDARGNKVYKRRDTLTKFGIAGADFTLADEVNMGTFTLRAILPDGQTEKKVNVERYVLPKFKLSVTTEKPYYLPGQEVKGTVRAAYFFGKPVSSSKVDLTINTVDIGVTKLAELKDNTDAQGVYAFRYTLPKSFVGQPFEQGRASVGFDVTLKDSADHKQEAHLTVPVVKDPITVVIVPERAGLVPGVENRVYIAAATPDGAPLKSAPITVTVTNPGGKPQRSLLTTDALGLATCSFSPGNVASVSIGASAQDADGHAAMTTRELKAAPTHDGLILRTDKTLAKVGERLDLTALSGNRGGTLYLDVIRNRQTIHTLAQRMEGGRADLSLPLTADMVGTLELHAYKILPDENIIRDTRVIVVSPADDLDIKLTADRVEYRPGADATLKFAVQDQQHRPVSAALGLAIVDESVFALSELQPGLEKIYFTLEKELMEPKVEIHGLRPTFLLDPGGSKLEPSVRQRAAAMLFAATPLREDSGTNDPGNGAAAAGMGGRPLRGGGRVRGGFVGGGFPGGGFPGGGPALASATSDPRFDFHLDTYLERYRTLRAAVAQEMVGAYNKVSDALQRYYKNEKAWPTASQTLLVLVKGNYLREADLKDRWGRFYKTHLYGPNYAPNNFTLISAGPDGRFDTADDIGEIGFADYGMFGRQLERGRMFGAGGFAGGMGGFRDQAALGLAPMADAPRALAAGTQMQDGFAFDATVSRAMTKAVYSEPAAGGGVEAAPRVREYFPETLYWNPALITDERGLAELKLPLADSITTWRVSMTASSEAGQLGSATAPIKVYQDFFADIDLPVALTQHDRVDLPVAVYNYLPTVQTVTLTLQKEPWFALSGSATQTVQLAANQVKVVYYPIVAAAIGHHALTVTARGSKLSDAVRRTIEVTPDGKEFRTAINDRLEGAAEKTVVFPANAVPGSESLWVKLYPGAFSQVVEGLDGILQMPNGCFEQTSSTTYPDVLVLDYLKQTRHINPELQMKAEQYINVGYQRLVTFECKNGGFSWFGDEPAHQILTAYGLLEFSDMGRVHEVDPNVIARTQRWLASKQQADGSWEEKGQGIAEGIINRQTGALRTTAYIAWALAESGYQGPEIKKGAAYLQAHQNEAKDPYTLAVILNLLTRTDRDGELTAQTAERLIGMARINDKAAWWQSETETFTGADREGADLETTGLAAYGLAKWGRNSGFTTKVLTYLVQSKNSFGTWSSTQGTVWANKALLYATGKGAGGNRGTVIILANGKPAGTYKITPEDSDVMRQVDLKESLRPGANVITLKYEGEGSPLYQIAGRYYLPWQQVAPPPTEGPISIDVAYDKTRLAQDDTATVTVRIHNNSEQVAEMPLIDLGVPPGFTVIPDNLDAAVQAKTINKYTVAARQVIVYMEELAGGKTVTLTYQVKARFPIKARTPLSKVYPYYNPERVAFSPPQDLVVQQ